MVDSQDDNVPPQVGITIMRHRDDEFPRCTRMLKSKRRHSKTKSAQTSSMTSRACFVFFLFTLFETRLDGVANFSQLVAGITQKEALSPFKLSFAFSSSQFISWSSRDFNVRLILVFGRTISFHATRWKSLAIPV